ncbi:MAG TPA: hypothetical protein VI792_02595, partial [Candidatus Eisenbacteria bacterium]
TLEGAHRAVPCAPCHTEMASRGTANGKAGSSLVLAARNGPALTFAAQKQDCASCHQDPHGGQFKSRRDHGACEACHDLSAFKPAARFDHDRDAAFKLEGVHARVACAKCHATKKTAGGAVVMYHGTPSRCESCHGNATDSLRDRASRKGGS